MKNRLSAIPGIALAAVSVGLMAALIWILWEYVPGAFVRYGILAVGVGSFLTAGLWAI